MKGDPPPPTAMYGMLKRHVQEDLTLLCSMFMILSTASVACHFSVSIMTDHIRSW